MKVLAFPALLLLALDAGTGERLSTGTPFAPGMAKATALALAGPDALAGTLCGGMDAVMQERGAASAMATFVAGRVAEVEALEAPPDCAAAFERRHADAAARWGLPLLPSHDSAAGTATLRRAVFRVRGGEAELVLRRFPGGACDVRLTLRAPVIGAG